MSCPSPGELISAQKPNPKSMETKTALITGVTGQDGSYLAELLLGKGYRVVGIVRRLSTPNLANLSTVQGSVEILSADLTDQSSLNAAVKLSKPDEIYNLGAQSFVAASFAQPELTGDVTGLGAVRMLEAAHDYAPDARFYQASSSEIFGRVAEEPQTETTPFHPRSPYGFAKVYAYWAAVNYREAYLMFVSNGILFNHESPRRGLEFVTRKISDGVARISRGTSKTLSLGNLEAARDWGYAPDYVDLMWRMLQAKEAEDFVGATGESHTVKDFLDEAFRIVGISDWAPYVTIDTRHIRPSEVFNLRGDASKARTKLGWTPTVRFRELVRLMVESDLKRSGG
jgi:GDPmannose 4,6-dehydratase